MTSSEDDNTVIQVPTLCHRKNLLSCLILTLLNLLVLTRATKVYGYGQERTNLPDRLMATRPTVTKKFFRYFDELRLVLT